MFTVFLLYHWQILLVGFYGFLKGVYEFLFFFGRVFMVSCRLLGSVYGFFV